ncbi:hypothetical protein FBUS_03550, partial [Fasciolopsis buskii]
INKRNKRIAFIYYLTLSVSGRQAIFFLVLVAAICVFFGEARPGRVKCSVACWEKLPGCKQQCARIRMSTQACYRDCQEKVAECIRDVCDVSEHVDTFEEHSKYD